MEHLILEGEPASCGASSRHRCVDRAVVITAPGVAFRAVRRPRRRRAPPPRACCTTRRLRARRGRQSCWARPGIPWPSSGGYPRLRPVEAAIGRSALLLTAEPQPLSRLLRCLASWARAVWRPSARQRWRVCRGRFVCVCVVVCVCVCVFFFFFFFLVGGVRGGVRGISLPHSGPPLGGRSERVKLPTASKAQNSALSVTPFSYARLGCDRGKYRARPS